jgi:hypothetical protein
VLTDWKLIVSAEVPPDRGSMFATYLACALFAALIGLMGNAALIYFDLRRRAARYPMLHSHALGLIQDYLTYGYAHYRERRDKIVQGIAAEAVSPVSLSKFGKALATLVGITALDRSSANPPRDTFIDQTLDAIEQTVRLFSTQGDRLTLCCNYMAYVSGDKLGGAAPRFVDESLESYAGFLVLRRYRDDRKAPICLPIERPDRPRRVLPGAPTCVFSRSACHINTDRVAFEPGVPQRIKTEVKEFFRDASYVSVLSVPLTWEREVVGVVNIESNQIDIIGRGDDMVQQIGEALAPISLLLGELVHRELRDKSDGHG